MILHLPSLKSCVAVQKSRILAKVDLAILIGEMTRAFVTALQHSRSATALVGRSQEFYLDALHLREWDPGTKGEE